jgi:hypothetical protein
MAPVREILLGMVDAASDAKRRGWLDRMRDYGRRILSLAQRGNEPIVIFNTRAGLHVHENSLGHLEVAVFL